MIELIKSRTLIKKIVNFNLQKSTLESLFSTKNIILLFFFLFLIPQLISLYKCPVASDYAAYFDLSQGIRHDVSHIDSAFWYRILPSLVVFFFNTLLHIDEHIIFWLMNIGSTILYFFFLNKVFSILLVRLNVTNSFLLKNIAVVLSFFCFTFQFYIPFYIHPEPVSLLFSILILFFYLKEFKTRLFVAMLTALFIKENVILFFIFIFCNMILNRKFKLTILFIPLAVIYYFFRRFWYISDPQIVDVHLKIDYILNVILSVNIYEYLTHFITVWGVFGLLWLTFFLGILKSYRSKKNKAFDLSVLIYFFIVFLTSLTVLGKFRSFAYLLPFVIVYSLIFLKDSNFKVAAFFNIIALNLVISFPYWFIDFFSVVQGPRTIVSIFVSLWAVWISFLLIKEIYQKNQAKILVKKNYFD